MLFGHKYVDGCHLDWVSFCFFLCGLPCNLYSKYISFDLGTYPLPRLESVDANPVVNLVSPVRDITSLKGTSTSCQIKRSHTQVYYE